MAKKIPSFRFRSLSSSQMLEDAEMRVMDTQEAEPSWTGPRVHTTSEGKRFHTWLCDGDQKQCLPYQETPFTETIQWRIFRIMAEFIEGFDFLSRLKKEVSVFGSARVPEHHPYYQMARRFGALCAEHGMTVITGGGPGIMEAANRGAVEEGGESIGLDIALPQEQRRNPYVTKGIGFNYFFTRKVMLSASSQAYIFFPGGFGTLDELMEMVELIQTKKMSDKVPVILVGKRFWLPFLQWVQDDMLEAFDFISPKDVDILRVVDSAEEAFEIVMQTHERRL